MNLAILHFKNEIVAGEEFGTEYSGIHHIGFEVEDMTEVETKLREGDYSPRDEINAALKSEMGNGHGGRNVETKYGRAGRRDDRHLPGRLGRHRRRLGRQTTQSSI